MAKPAPVTLLTEKEQERLDADVDAIKWRIVSARILAPLTKAEQEQVDAEAEVIKRQIISERPTVDSPLGQRILHEQFDKELADAKAALNVRKTFRGPNGALYLAPLLPAPPKLPDDFLPKLREKYAKLGMKE